MEISDIRPEMFVSRVYPLGDWTEKLTDIQQERLYNKLQLVRKVACKLAANMLKGTLKYENDHWSVEQWLDYATDDALDTVNYLFLMKEAMDEELRRTIQE